MGLNFVFVWRQAGVDCVCNKLKECPKLCVCLCGDKTKQCSFIYMYCNLHDIVCMCHFYCQITQLCQRAGIERVVFFLLDHSHRCFLLTSEIKGIAVPIYGILLALLSLCCCCHFYIPYSGYFEGINVRDFRGLSMYREHL